MKTSTRHLVLLSALALVLAAAPLHPQGTSANTTLSPLQVMKLRRVLSVHPRPGGKEVAFRRLEPRLGDEEPGGARAHVYVTARDARPGQERLLLGGKRSIGSVAWSPDGALLCFTRQGEGDQHSEVWALPMAGGEALRLTETPHGVESFRWSPDGTRIAYTVHDPAPKERAAARAMGFRQKVVDEDWRPISLWVWDRKSGASRRLTDGPTVFSFAWAPDGKRLAVGLAPRSLIDDRYMMTRLYEVDLALGQVTSLAANPGKLGHYAWSPDGRHLAYVSAADRRDPHAGMLYVVDRESRQVRPLTPKLEGMVHHLAWSSPENLVATISYGVQTHLERIDVTSAARTMLLGDVGVAYRDFDRAVDGTIYAVGSTAKHPEEVFGMDDDGLVRMTDSNPWLHDVVLGAQTVEKVTASDGLEIEGLLMWPVGYEKGRRYPLVIVAHGGPESHFSDGWLTRYSRWGQVLAGRGFFVWYPNYRASTGYGVAFAKADHGDPMGAEFTDHLDAIQSFVKRGLVDRARVGIGGGSYGGYAAAWAATRHSKHFACAVSFVPFVDIRTKWYTSDIPVEFLLVHYEEKWPHQQREFLSERSPLSWASECRTPLLILGGTSDSRVHPSQPFMLYRAVKTATGTPVRYVQYPGEGHGNRGNCAQYDYLVRTLRWLEHYLAPGDHRQDPLPPIDIDYPGWKAGKD